LSPILSTPRRSAEFLAVCAMCGCVVCVCMKEGVVESGRHRQSNLSPMRMVVCVSLMTE
jgi:hypothetical protein